MHNAPLQVGQRPSDVDEDSDGLLNANRPRSIDQQVPQGRISARHDQNPSILSLTAVNNRNDVARAPEVRKQQLAFCPWSLWHKLGDRARNAGRGRREHLAEPAAGYAFPKLPLIRELQARLLRSHDPPSPCRSALETVVRPRSHASIRIE